MGAVSLVDGDGSTLLETIYPDFNESLFQFLPKKAVGTTLNGQDNFELDGVRPLNVTNTDNRLIASATRLAIEPTLGALISEDQRASLGVGQ